MSFKNGVTIIILSILLTFSNLLFGNSADENLRLWYKHPANNWIETIPVGNGKIGAVVYGGIENEILGLNNSTLWSGAPSKNHEKKEGWKYLEQIRTHIFNGELKKAEQLCEEHLIGNKENYGTHLPMGNLIFDFKFDNENFTEYKREIDIQNSIAKVRFKQDGILFKREVFASNPDNVIVVKLTTNKEKAINVNLKFDKQIIKATSSKHSRQIWKIEGDAFEEMHSNGEVGVHFNCCIKVNKCNGDYEITDGGIKIENASDVELFITSNTNYKNNNPEELCLAQLKAIEEKSFKGLKAKHIADYRNLFDRVKLNLGTDTQNTVPTDERISKLKYTDKEPFIYALYYNYARYLLISSSRENSPLPMNLQGIWNDSYACRMPWTCDFHMDINMQQNYWMAESGNLSECHQPLFQLIESMVEPGTRTAKELYGQPGWVAHVFTNAWGFTAPGWGLGWGLHVTGGIWLASHLYHHYEYTLDTAFLKEQAYPTLKQAAIFFEGYLTEHPEQKYLVSGPSISPENKYRNEKGIISSETMGATCDAVLIHDLFDSCIKASIILDVDEDFRKILIKKKNKLQPLMIGKNGQLQEWLEDYEDAVPNHRHTSHLIALFPSSQITPKETPELAKAARKSLQLRLNQPNWEDVEWSRGNNINFYARLQDGEEALSHLKGLILENSSSSFLAFSRAGIAGAQEDIFSIDGNYSGACGISEMLVQSYNNEIYLHPALPKSWDSGEFNGVCTRNGFELDLTWKNNEIEKVEILSKEGAICNINYDSRRTSFKTQKGEKYILSNSLILKTNK